MLTVANSVAGSGGSCLGHSTTPTLWLGGTETTISDPEALASRSPP
jgi:hypothetical protein